MESRKTSKLRVRRQQQCPRETNKLCTLVRALAEELISLVTLVTNIKNTLSMVTIRYLYQGEQKIHHNKNPWLCTYH